jgi:signal peptidase I
MLTFHFADEKLSYDLGKSKHDAGVHLPEAEPEVEITGSGELEVLHIAIYRDTYYTSEHSQSKDLQGQAVQGNPFQLADDEFFALGDNSPASLDGRWWNKPGVGNSGKQFPVGIVPREYMVGKAFAVFWPSGFRPFEKFPFRIVPNLKEIKLIYGGSNKEN